MRTCKNIRKFAIVQVDSHAVGSLLDYPYPKENYNLIGIYLRKQKTFDVDPKTIQQISFTGFINITMKYNNVFHS